VEQLAEENERYPGGMGEMSDEVDVLVADLRLCGYRKITPGREQEVQVGGLELEANHAVGEIDVECVASVPVRGVAGEVIGRESEPGHDTERAEQLPGEEEGTVREVLFPFGRRAAGDIELDERTNCCVAAFEKGVREHQQHRVRWIKEDPRDVFCRAGEDRVREDRGSQQQER
jgi:hypothetical protein